MLTPVRNGRRKAHGHGMDRLNHERLAVFVDKVFTDN
jgi:hypothetical protein